MYNTGFRKRHSVDKVQPTNNNVMLLSGNSVHQLPKTTNIQELEEARRRNNAYQLQGDNYGNASPLKDYGSVNKDLKEFDDLNLNRKINNSNRSPK